MIRAMIEGTTSDGAATRLLLLGIVAGNVERLRDGRPILVNDFPPIEAGSAPMKVDVLVLYAATHAELLHDFREAGIDLPAEADLAVLDADA